ncbi:hypothetical protein NUW54_g14521 [Trametes sanguinea]|uniref:Uncharacterized protein n=1 Tax=Trametes sanguinea TaxID=158606 RepID=A0ACC1MC70_9APHY|nr:hypothetical protein NUW54_g14521 [Trametes sanguinea]
MPKKPDMGSLAEVRGKCEHARAGGNDATVERPALVDFDALRVPSTKDELLVGRERCQHSWHVFRRMLYSYRSVLVLHEVVPPLRSGRRVRSLALKHADAYLKVRVHAQHIVALRLPKAAYYSAAEAALCCPDYDADVVAFPTESFDGLDGAIARVVINNDDLHLIRVHWRVDLRERAKEYE